MSSFNVNIDGETKFTTNFNECITFIYNKGFEAGQNSVRQTNEEDARLIIIMAISPRLPVHSWDSL